MSVVCCKVGYDSIAFAADSIVLRGDLIDPTNSFSKLRIVNGIVIGGCGSCEELSLLFQFAATHQPASASEKDILAFLVEFAEWKRSLSGKWGIDNRYIIAFNGKAYHIEGFLVQHITEYYAIGAGADYASAALYLDRTAKEAVDVACRLCCYVASPIMTVTMFSNGATCEE